MEQKNCTLVEMARMMLNEHRTPRCFWVDAINTACYISNRIFLCSILNLTPNELHFGCKPSISHLRPFGCKCFILKHDNLDKFESRSSDGILLGYTPHVTPLLSHMMRLSMKLLHVLVMSLHVQVIRKWSRVSL
jgi:hypothetical protein